MKKISAWIMSVVLLSTVSFSFSTASAQSTSVSLVPAQIDVPFLELENAEIVVAVNLTLNNISELKKFTVILTFDGIKLEYYTSHAGDWGYGGSRSTNPAYGSVTMSGELEDGREMSGSGTFYSFVFEVLDVGSSEISLQYVYLEDKSGSEISYSMENDNVTIEVLPLEMWVDGAYQELIQDYEALLGDFQALNSSYRELLVDYDSLKEDYNQQKADYNNLTSDYSGLMQDYDAVLTGFQTLNVSYHELLANYDSLGDNYTLLESVYDNLKAEQSQLMSNYESLQSNYSSISNECDKLSEELVIKNDELSTTTILMLVFVITTLVLTVTVFYCVKKCRKKDH